MEEEPGAATNVNQKSFICGNAYDSDTADQVSISVSDKGKDKEMV